MLTPEITAKFKQGNISKNPDKTKDRVKEIWKPLDKTAREEILKLSGLSKITVERTYKNGNISAKLLAAIAYTLKVDPYFLTGEADEQNEYSDALLEQFLHELGYANLKNTAVRPKPRKSTEKKTELAPMPEKEIIDDNSAELPESPTKDAKSNALPSLLALSEEILSSLPESEKEAIESLTEDEIINLVKSFALRAKFASENKLLLILVKYILLR